MAKKEKPPKESLTDMVKELKLLYEHWEDLYKNGGSDLFWADGVNLELTKNHTLYIKQQIKILCWTHNLPLPDVYNLPELPDVSKYYMAKAENIRTEANKILERYQQNKDVQFLLEREKMLDEKTKKETGFYQAIGTYFSIRRAVEDNDLVAMRGCCINRKECFREISQCAQAIKNPASDGGFVQLCLF